MIVDTSKTDCSNCVYYKEYKTPKEVQEHPMMTAPGKLMACNGINGFGIVGPTFYCTNHTKVKNK